LFEIFGLHGKSRAVAELVLYVWFSIRDVFLGLGETWGLQDILEFLLW
jgi:hypothetical protein